MECAAILDSASLWQRLFSRNYKSAIKTFHRISLDRRKASRGARSRDLRTVAEHARKRKSFEGHTGYKEILGVHFNGINSAWDDLHAVSVWYESVFVALPDHRMEAEPFRRFMFSARVERLKAIKSNITTLAEHRSVLERVVLHVTGLSTALPHYGSSMISGSFDEIKASLEKLTVDLTAIRDATERAALMDGLSLREIPDALAAAAQSRGAISSIEDAKAVPELLGDAFDGVSTNLGALGATLQFAESVASGALPPKTADWLLCNEYHSRLTQLRGWLTGAHTCAEEWSQVAGHLTNISGSTFWKNSNSQWGPLHALAERALAAREELSQWSHFLRLRIQGAQAGLDKLTGLADSRALRSQELLGAYHYCFCNTLTRSIFGEHAQLSQVTGITQEKLRQQFASADKEAIRLYSERVAALIDRKQVPYGNQSGPVRTWSEMALLVNEMNKQKRHIPIRQLMLRAPNALVPSNPVS
jgi:hypothetical protein